MLKTVKILRYKSVKSFDREFGNLTILVGANNSGKSTILQGVHFAVAMAQSRRMLANVGIGNNNVSFSIAPQQIIYTPLNDLYALGHRGRLTQTRGKHIQIEFEFQNGHRGIIQVLKGRNRNLSVTVNGDHVISRIEDLSHPFSVYVPGLAGIAKQESFIARGQLLRAVARGDANLVLRNVLYALHSDNDQWRLFSLALREVFPEITVHVAFAPESDEFIDVNIVKTDFSLPLDAAGTGVLQTIQILSYVYLFKPAVTLLDEPDSHLHPNNQRSLARLLARFSEEGRTQIVLATHSRHILDQFRNVGERVWMRQGVAQANTQQLDLLVDLGALDSAEGLLAKGIKYVFITEDEKKKYLKALIGAYGINEKEYQIWSYKGSSNLEAAETLSAFIRDVSNGTKVIVHRDSDYLLEDDINRLRRQYKDAGLLLFLTPGVDVEGLFCRENHLKALNTTEVLNIDTAISTAIIECEEKMRKKADEGAKQVDQYRRRHDLASRGEEERNAWLNSIDVKTERWRHGKIFLASIRHHFQRLTGKNLETYLSSAHLKFPEFDALILPKQAPVVQAQAAQPPVVQVVPNPLPSIPFDAQSCPLSPPPNPAAPS